MRISAALVVLLLALSAVSQDRSNASPIPNTVVAGADGKYESAPDTALVQFNISAQGDTARAAYDQAAKQAEQTRQILRNNGIDPKTAEIGSYSIQPQYDWKNPKRKLVGYEVTTSVTLKLKDFGKIAPITEQLADANVGTGQSLSYTLENMDEAKSKAVEDAFRHARMSAEALARASGRTVGELSYGSVDVFENIRPVAMRAMAMPMAKTEMQPPTAEFTPQTVNVTAHVNAMFVLK
jgi:uncharacterized protein YggE